MFNPAKASFDIKREFIDYIRTANHFSDREMGESFVRELHRTVSKGPILDIKDTFEPSKSIEELIREGVLTEEFRELEAQKSNQDIYQRKLPLTRPLYTHQERAVRHIISGNNAVVTTGTGSGKTECFLIPILNELLEQKQRGILPTSGVQAILIYPMNALANDQIKRLRELLIFYPGITFGVYNGDTEHEYSKAESKYMSLHSLENCKELRMPLPNELISREQMHVMPPHILCTNYAMLEHLLLKPEADKLFSGADMRFIILDEAHVYHGVTGMETALLLRRLKARIRSTKNVRFVLTSATLGTQGENDDQIVHFAKTLTGVEYTKEDIIFGKRIVQQFLTSRDVPISFFRDVASLEDLKGLNEVFARHDLVYDEKRAPSDNLFELCLSANIYQKIRREIRQPIELKKFAEQYGLTEDESIELIHAFSKASQNGISLIDVRYHYFIRALEGAYYAPAVDKTIYLTRKKHVDMNGRRYAAFEIAVCPNCGDTALVGKIGDANQDGIRKLEMVSQQVGAHYFLIDRENSADDDTVIENEIVEEEEKQEKQTKSEAKFCRYYLCTECGAINEEQYGKPRCGCDSHHTVLLKELSGKDSICPKCIGEKMHRLYLPNNVATAVLGTSLFETLESREVADMVDGRMRSWMGGKQFLAFSDSRAEAAHFAPYMSKYYKMFLRKRGIVKALEQNSDFIRQNSYTASDLASDMKRIFLNNDSFVEKLDDRENVSLRQRENTAEKNAWIGVLGAMLDSEKAEGLTALGFLQFRYKPLYSERYNIISKYAQLYHTSEAIMEALLSRLVMTVVRFGALKCPIELDSDDLKYVFFSQRENFFTEYTTESMKSNMMGWMPRNRKGKANQWYRNARQDMVMQSLGMNEREAYDFLGEFYRDFLRQHILDRRQRITKNESFALDASDFEILVPGSLNAKWYKCSRCGHVSVYNINGKCTVRNCTGNLNEISPEKLQEDNHYVKLYRKERFQPLLIREHTAQLSRAEGQICQLDFEKNRINALSCSTTFEMGVDVGDLETVFMRDVPPTAANYAQRAGRAGRSKHAAAYALTYAKLSSHDFTFFEEPNRLIEGKIQPPSFKLDNEKVLLRHIYAVVLSYLFKKDQNLFGNNKFDIMIEEDGENALHALIEERPAGLTELLKRTFGKSLDEAFGISDYRWADHFIGEQGAFTMLASEYRKTITEYHKRMLEQEQKGMGDNVARHLYSILEKRQKLYKGEQLISMLSRNNVLPKYGFPVDTAELMPCIDVKNNQYKVQELQMVRDLKLAISEYAPGAKVIADGKMFTSRYIRKSAISKGDMAFHSDRISICRNCGETNYAHTEDPDAECISCKHPLIGNWNSSIEPRSGFITEPGFEAVPMRRPKHPYSNDACYIGNGNALNTYSYLTSDRLLRLHSTEKDKILILSKQHFYVCDRCGYAVGIQEIGSFIKTKKEREKAEKGMPYIDGIEHNSAWGNACGAKRLSKTYLHHVYETDVVKMEFDRSVAADAEQRSVMYALLNAMAIVLEVELSDIDACIVKNSSDFSIIFYDTCAGGAGHVHRMLEENGKTLEKILRYAYQLVSNCTCDTSCYSCLRDYNNQRDHEKLDRMLAAKILSVYQGNCQGWIEGEAEVPSYADDCDGERVEETEESSEVKYQVRIIDNGLLPGNNYKEIWEYAKQDAYESWEEAFFDELIDRANEMANFELPRNGVLLQLPECDETISPMLSWPTRKTALFFVDNKESYNLLKHTDWEPFIMDEKFSSDALLKHIKEG